MQKRLVGRRGRAHTVG